MDTRADESDSTVIKQEVNDSMPCEIMEGLIPPATIKIKKEEVDPAELIADHENLIGNNDPVNIKSEDVINTHGYKNSDETSEQTMIGTGISLEDELESSLNLKGEVIDMNMGSVKDEPEWSDSSSSSSSDDQSEESQSRFSENSEIALGFHINEYESRSTADTSKNIQKKFGCNSCGFQTNIFRTMKNHLLVHFGKIYSCDKCSLKTRHKSYLKEHFKYVHRDPSAPKLFSCDLCDFQTNRKASIARHSVIHTPFASEKKPKIDWYKCEICDFKSKRQYFVMKHAVIHKPPDEVELFKCELCPYTSKFSGGVYNHMTVHKNSSETIMYECELCPYKTKWSHCLRNHLKTHKKQKVPVHKCQHCDFEANNKYSIATHQKNAHKELSKKPDKEFRCALCSYTTKMRSSFSRHATVHNKEKQLFTCAICELQVKSKKTLRMHILRKHDFLKRIMENK